MFSSSDTNNPSVNWIVVTTNMKTKRAEDGVQVLLGPRTECQELTVVVEADVVDREARQTGRVRGREERGGDRRAQR